MKRFWIFLFVVSLVVSGIAYADHSHKGKSHIKRGSGGVSVNLLRPNEYCGYVDGLSVVIRTSSDKDGLHLFYFKDSVDQEFLGKETILDGVKVYDSYIGNNGALGWSCPYWMRFTN